MSRRTQAWLATGALAVSMVTPPAVSAQEPDSHQEGAAEPHDLSAGPDGPDRPSFDPGGGDTDLPFDDGAADPMPDNDDPVAPLEAEPDVDTDVPRAPRSDAGGDPSGDRQPEAPVPPSTAPQEVAPPPSAPNEPEVKPRQARRLERRAASQARHLARSRPQRSSPAPSQAHPPALQLTQATQPTPEPASQQSPGTNAGRIHVVRPGESLWSIARSLLPAHASTAAIARKVNALWSLNAERIATGDPDLLRVGTTLQLP